METVRQIFKAKPKSFLDAARRDWQFATFAWLLRGCGGYSKFLETTLVLPIEEHFPDRGMKGHAAVAAIFRRVRDHAGMADWPCVVEPLSSQPAAVVSDRMRVVHYPPAMGEMTDPGMLVAHLARELAHYLVESFEEPPQGGAELYEPTVELAAVFMGFGVFLANSSAQHACWELNEGELAHALALFCLLRRVPVAGVDAYLNAHLRKHVRLAAQDLARHERELCLLRALVPDEAERTLPTRAG